MKLRLRDDSIRLRLTRGEVERFAAAGRVEARVHFPAGAALAYALCQDAHAAGLEAAFADGVVTVTVPAALAQTWAASDRVALSGEQPLAEGVLRILVEKDFACLAPREGEDDADAFPHPLAGRGDD